MALAKTARAAIQGAGLNAKRETTTVNCPLSALVSSQRSFLWLWLRALGCQNGPICSHNKTACQSKAQILQVQ